MSIAVSLYTSSLICLAPLDPEKDAEVEAKWTQDAEYRRQFDFSAVRPYSPAQIKKHYEAIEKQMDERGNLYHFAVRLKEDDTLLGFARLSWIAWNNGDAAVTLGIGDPAQRRKGYGRETLGLLVRFAFDELNLFRLSARLPTNNTAGLALLTKAGFVEEVRRRKALRRDGQDWDMVHMGLLASDWQPAMSEM